MTTPDILDGILMPYAVQFLPVVGSEFLQIPVSQQTNGTTSTVLFLPAGTYQAQIMWRGSAELSSSIRTQTAWFEGPKVPYLESGSARMSDPFPMIVPETSANGRIMLRPALSMTQWHIDQGWAATVHVIPWSLPTP